MEKHGQKSWWSSRLLSNSPRKGSLQLGGSTPIGVQSPASSKLVTWFGY
jgi:hypothetical protein